MIWLAALLMGATVACLYCASLWIAVDRAVGGSHPIAWLGIAAVARLGVIGAIFFALTLLGADVALWALLGFAAARSSATYCIGRPR
jgi:F1F0 ATPase subunit 2